MYYDGTKLKRKMSEISDLPCEAPPEAATPKEARDSAIAMLSLTS